MRIGIDIMGGDYAPEATVMGAIEALKELPESVELVLIGDEGKIKEIFERENFSSNQYSIVHTTEVIEMGEHPAKTFSKKN
jgi:phosphate acyltransferase